MFPSTCTYFSVFLVLASMSVGVSFPAYLELLIGWFLENSAGLKIDMMAWKITLAEGSEENGAG